MLGSLFSAPAGGASAMSGIGNFFGGSDRRMKTDIQKVGRHPAGVPMYSFRYKGDPKTFPKVVGPMAEDVAKIAPHAVAPIPGSGGKMAVNMGALNALPPSRRALGLVPGALSSPGVAGAIGALGASMRGAPRGAGRKPRMPQIRGALGG
jgi:hypothetical protein